MATLVVLPIRPGQSEAWRRHIQELQESRRDEFAAACQRWGVWPRAAWIVPARPGDLAVVEVEAARDLADVMERLASSDHLFDAWFRERVRELHGVDPDGVARYRAQPVARWPSSPAAGIDPEPS